MYYFYIDETTDKICGKGLCQSNYYNLEVSEQQYSDDVNKYLAVKSGDDYTIEINPNYEAEQLANAKADKNAENTQKAKEAVENGYVEYKNAQFETNAQTVSDLTATMLLMQASGLESYTWLSKDDKEVELTLSDFGILGGLIAGYKAHIWNDEYLSYKQQIEAAQTAAEIAEIEINY